MNEMNATPCLVAMAIIREMTMVLLWRVEKRLFL